MIGNPGAPYNETSEEERPFLTDTDEYSSETKTSTTQVTTGTISLEFVHSDDYLGFLLKCGTIWTVGSILFGSLAGIMFTLYNFRAQGNLLVLIYALCLACMNVQDLRYLLVKSRFVDDRMWCCSFHVHSL